MLTHSGRPLRGFRIAAATLLSSAAGLATFGACGGRSVSPASCFGPEGGAMTCPLDAPVCQSVTGDVMNAGTNYGCLPLGACASDPSCNCLQQNGIDQCTTAHTTQCAEGSDGIHITCKAQ